MSAQSFIETRFSEQHVAERVAALVGTVRNIDAQPILLRSIYGAIAPPDTGTAHDGPESKGRDSMMGTLRITLGRLFAAVLLTLCLGVQLLEATGRWDGTLQDTTDEAVVVAVVLCVGAGIAAARAMRPHLSLSAIRSVIVVVRAARRPPTSFSLPAAFRVSPPLSLRI